MRKTISQTSFSRLLRSKLNRGQDIDYALDNIEKYFEVVSDEQFKEMQLEIAKQKGFI